MYLCTRLVFNRTHTYLQTCIHPYKMYGFFSFWTIYVSIDRVHPPPTQLCNSHLLELHALVDTGSGQSLITDCTDFTDSRKTIPASSTQPNTKSFTLASSVTGNFLDVLGIIFAPIHIGNVMLPHNFHVARARG